MVKFPAEKAGTVQECPNCMAYLDVPDPDGEWAEEDIGDAPEAEP